MRRMVILLGLLIYLCCPNHIQASIAVNSPNVVEQKTKKIDRHDNRLHRKIHRIQSRIIKTKEKVGESVLDEDGFLENSDDRIRWGLVGVAGGIILSLILTSSLKWIGTLSIVAGLGLLIWYLIDP